MSEEGDDGALHEHDGLSPRAHEAFRRIVGRAPTDADIERIKTAVNAVIQALREEADSGL